ncbi:MAG: DNA repair protein RecO [Proteobacteria bacterium]|nr:DNA repair protein RecO [Pseudomonadota bacterium]
MQGVIVGGTDVGEAHRICRLLTPEEGNVSLMVRQARASKKRFAGLLDPGTQLVVRTKKGRGGLPLLVDADLVTAPNLSRQHLERLALLAYGCEVCSRLAPEGYGTPKLFKLLVVWLEILEGEKPPTQACRLALEAKALTFAGLTPRLHHCALCDQTIEDSNVFDAEAGGALHSHCGSGRLVSGAALMSLERLRRTPLAQTVEPQLVAELDIRDVRWLLADFVQHQICGPLKSRDLVADVGM